MRADSPVRRRTSRPQALRGWRRQPKTLDREPVVHDVAAGGAGAMATVIGASRRRPGRAPGTGRGGAVTTDEQARAAAAPDETAPSADVLRQVRRIAARLALPKPRPGRTGRRGLGELASVRYRGDSDDLDLDRTIDQLVAHPIPEEEHIVVRQRIRPRRAVVVLVDVSGSMRGERVRTAAAAFGALAAELVDDHLAVIAFWSDAAVLAHLDDAIPPLRILDTMLRIQAKGLTNLAFPLELAADELRRLPLRDARVVLLSDCVHNAGPDPRPAAAALPRLDVLLDTAGEHDLHLARDLAHLGRGTVRSVTGYRTVAPALSEVFAA